MSDPIRVLIVEDDVVTATMFRDMLEHAGYIITGHAVNGAQAITMTADLRPDVVLMDIRMPGMDGITCAEIILAQCPTPVIIISGYDDPRLVERAKRSGVGAYLVKPVKLADLQRSIVLVLARFQDLMKLRHLAAIMECSQDAVFSTTPDGIILTWNSAAERVYGYSLAEITGKSIALLFPPGRKDEFDRLLEKIKQGEQVKVYETVMTGQHGKCMTVSVSLALIRDANGSVAFAAAIVRDVTERKRAEDEIKRIKAAIDATSDAIGMATADERHFYQNAAFDRLFGYTLEELSRQHPAVLYVNETDARNVFKTIMAGKSWQGEIEMIAKHGRRFPVVLRADAVKDESGNIIGLIGVHTDVTERKRAEEEAQLNRREMMRHEHLVTLGTLAAGIAHEINNPTHVILLNASVLQTILGDLVHVLDDLVKERADFLIGKISYTTLKPNLLKIAQGIAGAGQRISDIVAALKDFVRPDDSANSFESVDMNEVVRKALDLLASPLRKSTHRFSVVYGEDLPRLSKGRARKIEQVVINLLVNACQSLSGPDKAVRIITGHDRDANSLVITVEDEGCGIPANLIPRIKDPFFTTKRSKGGTGLGLSISDAIVREHRGRLEFTSREGCGTTARMVLPINPPAAMEEP